MPIFQPFFALIIASVIGMALWEYCRMVSVKGYSLPDFLLILCSTAYIMVTYLNIESSMSELLPEMILLFTLILIFAYYFLNTENAFSNIAFSLFGFIYLTITLSLSINIIYFFPEGIFPDGRYYFFFLLIVTKMTDTAAYFIGKRFGKHKLSPYISPNKTWEGAFGGIAIAAITGFILSMFPYFFEPNTEFINPTDALFLSIIIAVLAQFGDLCESLLKRDAKIKDSNQLPGLGGVLDMVDSLIFTIPLMYIYLSFQTIQR